MVKRVTVINERAKVTSENPGLKLNQGHSRLNYGNCFEYLAG